MSFEPYGGVYVPKLTKINKVILILCGVLFLLRPVLLLLGNFQLDHYLGLSLYMVRQGHLYQYFTYSLMQPDLMGFIFNALVLWFIGSDLEMGWGSKAYTRFLLFSTLGSAFTYTVMSFTFFAHSPFQHPLMGLNGICYGLLLAYGMLYKDRLMSFMLFFPMKAKYFCLLIVGIELYMGLFSLGAQTSWAHLGAFASTYLFLRFSLFKVRRSMKKSAVLGKRPKSRADLYLIKDANDDDEDSQPKNGPRMWH